MIEYQQFITQKTQILNEWLPSDEWMEWEEQLFAIEDTGGTVRFTNGDTVELSAKEVQSVLEFTSILTADWAEYAHSGIPEDWDEVMMGSHKGFVSILKWVKKLT